MSIVNDFKAVNNIIASKKKEIATYTSRKKKEMEPFVHKQKELGRQLYLYMVEHDLDSYQGISIEEVQPKQKVVKEKISRSERMVKLRQMGIRNPDEALKEIGL